MNTFSIKLIYRFLNDGGCRLRYAKYIWRVWCPLKIRVFLWLLAKEALLTLENLQKREWIGPNICVLCGHEEESTQHITLSCEYARVIWSVCINTVLLGHGIDCLWEHVNTSRQERSTSHQPLTLYAGMFGKSVTVGFLGALCTR